MRQVVIDNRYKVLKKLGTGATGIVYKVRDLKDKKIIALKILSKERTSSEAIQRFKREFRLLAGLRHPNLCSVYNFGMLKDGRSYFTMEYIDVPNIFEFTKNSVRKNISHGVYPMIVQLCRVLEYIHSKGLIHYDIKPSNVLIAKSIGQRAKGNKKPYAQSSMPCVKLMDFGLAGEQRIRGGALIKGTFPYIAPEVVKGLAIDHRADLYSLGVLLYEIITRRRFYVKEKESYATLLKQRIEQIFEPPSKIADIPKGLERLIVKLIAYEPAQRFGHANEVIKGINKFSRLKFSLETEKTTEGYLLSSRFVGRDKEMDLLKSFYEQARHGEGKVILVIGEAGIGKSRLLKEFRIFTQLRRGHSFIGYAYKDKTGPLEPFHDIFSELINYIRGGFDLSRSRELKFSLAVLFKIFPDLTNGHLRRGLPQLVPLEPKQEKIRTFDALSGLIKHIASELSELVILLEDLHWADDSTIQFLEYLGRNLEGENILICGTSRIEELQENIVFKKTIVNLTNRGYFTQIELKPLKFRSLYSFLDSTITSSSNSSELTRYLMKKTGGNPFFVEEIMRIFLRKRGMSIGEKIEIEDLRQISIPGTIENVVLKRIKDLDSVSQKVIKFGAILLKDFNYGLMKRLTGLDDTELSRSLWELKRNQVLVEKNNKYRFYHATLRDAVSGRLGDKERSDLNYQIGKTLEKINQGRLNSVIEDLAYYFINAKDHKRGVRYGLRAAEKSSHRWALEQSIEFYESTLVLLDETKLRCQFEILTKLADIEKHAGYYEKAIRDCNKALNSKIGTIYEKIKLYMRLGGIYEAKYEYNKALRIFQRAVTLLTYMKSKRIKILLNIYINGRICKAYQRMGEFDKVSQFYFDVAKLPTLVPKERELIILLGGIYFTFGEVEFYKMKYSNIDFNKAIFYFKKSHKYFKKTDDLLNVLGAITNIAVLYYAKCDFQRAFDYHQKSMLMYEKIGWQHGISVASYNLGLILYDQGYYSKALDYFRKIYNISQKYRDVLNFAASLYGHGLCLHKLCSFHEAKNYFERALKIFNNMGWSLYKAYQLHAIGSIYQKNGQYTKSLQYYRRALKTIRSSGFHLGSEDIYIDVGSVFLDIGKFLIASRYAKNAAKIIGSHPAKDKKIECYILLCRTKMMKNYIEAKYYCEKGINIAKELWMRHRLVRLYILLSDICHQEGKYLKGIKIAKRAEKIAREMGTKDLYTEALLMKVKNGVKQGILSKIEAIKTLNEAKGIAEEIGSPEVLWRVYFEYGKFLQYNKVYPKALEYYEKCHRIFIDVGSKIKNESYRHSYLDHPDRQAVFSAVREIKKLV